MKITRVKTEVFEFDPEAELKRLHRCFKGKQLKRQLAIFDAMFKEKDFKKVEKLYNNLPRCKKQECSEMEYVGLWMSIFTGGWGEHNHLVECDITYDFEKII